MIVEEIIMFYPNILFKINLILIDKCDKTKALCDPATLLEWQGLNSIKRHTLSRHTHTCRVPSANRKRVIKLHGYAHSCNALNFSRHRTNRSMTRVHGKY